MMERKQSKLAVTIAMMTATAGAATPKLAA
jgi:hypothetical protein